MVKKRKSEPGWGYSERSEPVGLLDYILLDLEKDLNSLRLRSAASEFQVSLLVLAPLVMRERERKREKERGLGRTLRA